MHTHITTMMLWVVPITIPVQNANTLWDPQTTGLSEWVQLYPDGGDPASNVDAAIARVLSMQTSRGGLAVNVIEC